MKKKFINTRLVNFSFWITLILAYVIPTKQFKVYGYPFEFFKIYGDIDNGSLISSSTFEVLPFLLNVLIFYIISYSINLLIKKFKDSKFYLQKK